MTTATLTVRRLEAQDIGQAVILLELLRRESVFGLIPFQPDPLLAARVLEESLDDESRVAAFVAVEDDQVAGIAVGEVTGHRLMPDLLFLVEHGLYVLPVLRATGIGRELWGRLMIWGQVNQARVSVRNQSHRALRNGGESLMRIQVMA